MSPFNTLKRAACAVALAALGSLLAMGSTSAQTLTSDLVRVESPGNGSVVNGVVTFRGVAVDCSTGAAATRVAVYDGSTTGAYLGDASIDTTRSLAAVCPGLSGSSLMGFTWMFDSNRLAEGQHTLAFVAQYPNGTSQTTTTSVNVDNIPNQGYYNYNSAYYSGSYLNGAYTTCVGYSAQGICQGYQSTNNPSAYGTYVNGVFYPNGALPNGAYLPYSPNMNGYYVTSDGTIRRGGFSVQR